MSFNGDQGWALEVLERLVKIESPSGDVAASARIAREVSMHFEAVGASVTVHQTEAGTNLVAEVPGTGAPLLLVGHLDTVWPVGTLDGELPWSVSEGVVRGPGVYDMKSGVVVMLGALARVAGQSHRRVRVVLVCDEEVGSSASLPLIREASAGVVGALGFESPHPDGALKLGRWGSTRVQLAVAGKAAHAALDPDKGVSAIDELVDQLVQIRHFIDTTRVGRDLLCNVGVISGGSRTNVIADRAVAEIGLRFGDVATEQLVLDWLDARQPIRAGAQLDVRRLSQRPTWQAADADRRLLGALAAAGDAVGQSIAARPALGGGDTNFVAREGVPTIDGFGPRGGGAHALNEHILLASLSERMDLVAELLTGDYLARISAE